MRISVPFDAVRVPGIGRLTASAWSFGSAGEVYSPFVTFRADGSIGGHRHPDETAWSIRDGALVLLDEYGRVSLIFDDHTIGSDGRSALLGRKTIREERSYELVEVVPAHAGQRRSRRGGFEADRDRCRGSA